MIGGLSRFLGRVLFGGLFLAAGLNHGQDAAGTAKMIHKDFPGHLVKQALDAAQLKNDPMEVAALGASADDAEAEEETGRATMLLLKTITPATGVTTSDTINVTLTAYNKGPGNAYSLVVNDDNWKQDKFRVVVGGNNFTLDYLNAGESYKHEFVVKPIKKMNHRIRPAKMAFVDGVEGENTIVHLSNTLPDLKVVIAQDKLEDYLLTFGRVITFNTVQTKKGWMTAAGILIVLLVIQLYYIAAAVLQKRRHLRALDDVKKM
jgi:hypothetical protein